MPTPKIYRRIILPEAQTDIRKTIFYIAGELKNPDAALNLQDDLQETIDSLKMEPARIKLVEEEPWKSAGVRRVRVKNYYIYFFISEAESAVKIMAVIYTGRDQKKQMTKRRMEAIS